ncbi:hypothetical protein GK047_01805 [Paenibacillus sp. SYP-B3998]|uniref:Phage abortive infection protein n=1 Tax=Paenibacillus sp. SYP-B3998 TaxID=2678564 RepID=A0A6G3ZRL4_9BACL|nr:hypothetical protein [Paenibacillus sp. SYP-B3998]NEW04755.1 hypothetical protein [Paenibacillus sp. SYP-B3998]
MKYKWLIIFGGIGSVVIATSFAYGAWINKHMNFSSDGTWGGWESSGVFGDSFGALNTVFSGLAFVGVITTIFMQQKALRDQDSVSRMQFNQNRYEYLMGQVKAWVRHNPDVSKNLTEIDKFVEALSSTGSSTFITDADFLLVKAEFSSKVKEPLDLNHFAYMFKTVYHFIMKAYVPQNPFLQDIEEEKRVYVNILKSKVRKDHIILLAVYAIIEQDTVLLHIFKDNHASKVDLAIADFKMDDQILHSLPLIMRLLKEEGIT